MSKAPNTSLDEVDVSLLVALRDNGRATVQSIADKAGLSAAATSVRLGRLHESGAVRGIHADIDEQVIGYELCAYLLLRVQDSYDRMQFTSRIFSLPEITEIAWVTGDHDVLATCWAKDRNHLEAIIEAIIAIGARTTTMLVLGDVYRKPGIAFEEPPTRSSVDHSLPVRRLASPQL